jgi:hypothetical protein
LNFLRQAKTNEVINEETDNEFEELPRANRPTYWLTRFMILRLLGLVYAIAFLVAINQIIPLIGSHGLTPIGIYLKNVSAALGSNGAGFMRLPSIFWVWHSDTALLTGHGSASCFHVWSWLASRMHQYSLFSGFFICRLFISDKSGMDMDGKYNLLKRVFLLFFFVRSLICVPFQKEKHRYDHCFISLADLSHHGWFRIDQASRR